MKITEVVSELEIEMEESQNQRDKRVEELWKKLDPQGKRELDFKGLKKGLRRIDHPMKNADDMLKGIVRLVDTSGDGKIQYDEFRVFVEAAERQLLLLFRSIDKNGDGKVGKEELRMAFKTAGLAVPGSRLDGFFNDIDMNKDGYISFDEWRDFLLFMPTPKNASPLAAAWSYYASIVTVSSEGDSTVSDETLEGLGTVGFIFQALFGTLVKLASQPPIPLKPPRPPPPDENTALNVQTGYSSEIPPSTATMQSKNDAGFDDYEAAVLQFEEEEALDSHEIRQIEATKTAKSKLTEYLPHPGYFLAGAVSGGVSRTATAPLDRLKVYLLVNTQTSTTVALDAVKRGRIVTALRNSYRPFGDAVVTLWKAGGFRTFFAGNGLNVIKIMPESAIRFGSYEFAKKVLANYEGHGDPQHIQTWSKFVAGGIGGMTAQFCVYPIDTLKFRLQCETVQGGLKGNALLTQTARTMWADGGLRAAYRGLTMGLIGMFPYSAIDIGTFEFLKHTFTKYKARYYSIHEEDAAPGSVVTAVIGATSGATGATIVYPLNVLRTRLQTQGTAMHPPTYTGIWDVATRTVRHEGFRGLYKGLTPNILKVAPALSITWVVYENTKRVLDLQ
ncbi:mitochondrial carrier domain-containing protein [Coniochaeta sp. 2T2.1]|nr:mitochondrial carrier domain-containing protein [Coniochaeta sp. 2T2.1]